MLDSGMNDAEGKWRNVTVRSFDTFPQRLSGVLRDRASHLDHLVCHPLQPGSVSQYRKARWIAGSANNVGQDEILHIGTGWLYPLDSDRP
jgi:hypothetical protein